MPNQKNTPRRNDKYAERTRAREGTVIVSSADKSSEAAALKHQQAWAAYRLGKGPKPGPLVKAGSPTKDQHLANRIKNNRSKLQNAVKNLAKAEDEVRQLDDAKRSCVAGKKIISNRDRLLRSVKELREILLKLDPSSKEKLANCF